MHPSLKNLSVRASLLGVFGLATSPFAVCDSTDSSKRRPKGFKPELYKIKYKAGQKPVTSTSSSGDSEANGKENVKKDFSEFLIMSGTTNTALAKSVCKLIGTTPTR